MSDAPYDARMVCNLLLDEAERSGVSLTHVPLQKLLYFAHGFHLVETKTPLVQGYFEAWTYGPVHPAAYRSFKAAGATAIRFRAMRTDPLTGASTVLPNIHNPEIIQRIQRVVRTYGGVTPSQLVQISHAPRGPWHYVTECARSSAALGLRIPNSAIQERFKYHKVSIGSVPLDGEPGEDTPFA
ncbi:MAG: type II toxin-antitoxin system antitoxin SocA domain-containing protein [Pseudomonadota bacterium]